MDPKWKWMKDKGNWSSHHWLGNAVPDENLIQSLLLLQLGGLISSKLAVLAATATLLQ